MRRISPEMVGLFQQALQAPPGVRALSREQMARIVCDAFHTVLYVVKGDGAGTLPDFPKDMKINDAVAKAIEIAYNRRGQVITFGGEHIDEMVINQNLPQDGLTVTRAEDRQRVIDHLKPLIFEIANHRDMDDHMVGLEVLSRAAGAISNNISYTIRPSMPRGSGGGRPDASAFARREVHPGDPDYLVTAISVALERTRPDFPGHL